MPVGPTVATDGLTLLQVPPVTTSVNEVVMPGQISRTPVIAGGNGFTVTMPVLLQPAKLV